MRCQHCGSEQTWVLDSRMTQDGFVRRRRYRCGSCRKRFTTYERQDRNIEINKTKIHALLKQAESHLNAICGREGEQDG